MKRVMIVAILTLLPCAVLRAEEQLAPLDLEAAYCGAATAQLRDAEPPKSDVAEAMDDAAQRFDRYLSRRGFANRTDLPLLTHAEDQGKSDGQEAHHIAELCVPQCPTTTAEQKTQLRACLSACERHFDTHGVT